MAEDKDRDPDRRKAALIATCVAVPTALAAGWGAFALLPSEVEDDSGSSDSSVSAEPVEIDVPDLAEDDAVVCRALVTELPEELGDLPQRTVSGDDGAAEVSVAWGDPPVTMRCGVEHVEPDLEDDVYRLGPACWNPVEHDDHTVWTSVDRAIPVEISTPGEYDGPGQLVQAVSDAVHEKVPAAAEEDVPSGCGW